MPMDEALSTDDTRANRHFSNLCEKDGLALMTGYGVDDLKDARR